MFLLLRTRNFTTLYCFQTFLLDGGAPEEFRTKHTHTHNSHKHTHFSPRKKSSPLAQKSKYFTSIRQQLHTFGILRKNRTDSISHWNRFFTRFSQSATEHGPATTTIFSVLHSRTGRLLGREHGRVFKLTAALNEVSATVLNVIVTAVLPYFFLKIS